MAKHDERIEDVELDDALERCISGGDAVTFGAVILRALASRGYVHVQRRVPFSLFEASADRMGTISQRSEVRIDVERNLAQRERRRMRKDRPGIYTHEPLGFHTDHPSVSFIGWYCHRQDEVEGATQILDMRNMRECFSPDEIAAMCRLKLWRGHHGKDSEYFEPHPLLSEGEGGYDIYYTPWLMFDEYAPEERALFEKLDRVIEDKANRELIAVRLAPEECLFLDNRRMIHARGAIAPDSKRHLTRLYIQRSPEVRGDS